MYITVCITNVCVRVQILNMAGANQIRVCLDDTEKFCDCLQAIITTVRSRILNLNHQVCAATNACQTKSARYGIGTPHIFFALN